MGLRVIRTIAPEEKCPPVRVRVWVRFRVSFRAGGQSGREPRSEKNKYPVMTLDSSVDT